MAKKKTVTKNQKVSKRVTKFKKAAPTSAKKSLTTKEKGKKVVPKKAVPKKTVFKKTASKKTMPKKATSKKVVPQKTIAKKVVPKKTVPKKVVPKKTASKKAAPQKAAPQKTVPQKATTKKTMPSKEISKNPTSKRVSIKTDFFTPIDNRILILIDESSYKTTGGLYIPETAQTDSTEGVVVAVGCGRRDKKGRIRPMDVKIGDKVIFKKYGGHKIRLQDSEMIIIQEDEIVGIRTT